MKLKSVSLLLVFLLIILAAPGRTGGRDNRQAPPMTSISGQMPTAGLRVPGGHAGVASKALGPTGDFGRVPVYFVPNRGQMDPAVAFYAQGKDKSVYFSQGGLTIAMEPPTKTESRGIHDRWSMKLDFLGARKEACPEGLKETGGVVSYFRGKPDEWKTGLPAYSEIIYRDLWPGIDLVYKGGRDLLKYEFIVDPGADPSKIRIGYRGTTSAELTKDGGLSVETPAGSFKDDVPVAYQETRGGRQSVPADYALESSDSTAPVIGFKVGDYDRGRTLVLDPAVIIFCGYIGTPECDSIWGVDVDGSGNVYVAGVTYATTGFPVKTGPDLTFNGNADAFVAKLNESGTAFSYCGYIGGTETETAWCLAVDSAGNAYVAGTTESNVTTFPVKTGPDLTYGGGVDAFVAKVNPDGTGLVYCGYVGGSKSDGAHGIAVDGTGRAYIVGHTFSSDLPTNTGPDLTFNGGKTDAFVGRINAAGTGFEYLGYIGGSNGTDIIDDTACGIAVDAGGNAYVVGDTCSSNLPVAGGPGLTFGGARDGFVAKVNASGTGFSYLGYIGGTGEDGVNAVAVDAAGAAYVAGKAGPSDPPLPVKVGPDLTPNGNRDAFVAKIDPSGAGFIFLGFIGGNGDETAYGIAVDGSGQAFVCGETNSVEASFPVLDGPDLTYNGGLGDAFVAGIAEDGSSLVFCGYIGGSEWDCALSMAVDPLGDIVVGGWTDSDASTFPVEAGPGLTAGGGQDGYVAKIGAGVPGPTLTSLTPSGGNAGDPGFTLSVFGSVFIDGAVVRWNGSARPTTFVSASEIRATIDAADLATGKDVHVTVKNPDGGISNSLIFSIANPVPVLSSLSTTQVTGGCAEFTLGALGSDFVPNSVVRWNGNDRATTYVNGTELRACVLWTDVALQGQGAVTVFNPAPGGGVSGSMTVQVSSFSLAAGQGSSTVTAGQSATYTITATPQNGSFDAAVSFACQGLPGKCTATFSPASVTPGSASPTTTLTLATKAPSGMAAAARLSGPGWGPMAGGLLVLVQAGLAAAAVRRRPARRLQRHWIAAAALIIGLTLIGSCSAGGGGQQTDTGTPKGTYVISVQGTSGNMSATTSVTLIVN